MQNAGHIKALKEQSEQIARLPIYNIVLFDGNCTLKDITYPQFGTFVGYSCNIMQVLKTVKGFGDAEYTDKREVARVLRESGHCGKSYGRRTKLELELSSTCYELASTFPKN